ncbi:MAG: WbqC family protein [Bacteroidia bacterium]|nr:WbqC family protein [Bacteroidia bacterium]
MNQTVILSTAYLPNIQYFSKILAYKKIEIEKHENFVKQSFRNRCSVYGANGKLDLTVPLIHSSERTLVSQKKISYRDAWQKLHWKTISSAYRSSPYFEFFEQDFEIFYEKEYEFLFDFNFELIKLVCSLLKISPEISFTETYQKEIAVADDLRNFFRPQNDAESDKNFQIKEYYQVFGNKYGFIPNLSIIDLLFNEGLNTLNILKMDGVV